MRKAPQAKTSGYSLEYDAARKIAQSLGVHLEKLSSLVTIKGSQATLLAVSDRTPYLFGKDEVQQTAVLKKTRGKSTKARQITITGEDMGPHCGGSHHRHRLERSPHHQ